VVDESTRIRNPKAQITKLLCKRAGHITHRAILSGLPNPEDDLDLFEQFRFLLGDFLGYENYWAFRQRYFYQGFADYDWRPRKDTKEKIKEFVHRHSFFLSRKKAGVGSEKIYERRTVPMNALQQRALREISVKMALGKTETKWAPVAHQWMQIVSGGFSPESRQVMSDAKPKALRELVNDSFRGKSVVVWFAFNHEIEYCYSLLKGRQRQSDVEWCHGKVSKRERAAIQARFQAGTTRVLLIQEALGQFGWRLDRANVQIYYSNNYEFEDRSQSEDRLIHVMKTDPVLVIDLVTLGSADEDIVDTLRDKKLNAKSFHSALSRRLQERLSRVRPGEAM
jgi:SNF2 family DNA or RNA helicase